MTRWTNQALRFCLLASVVVSGMFFGQDAAAAQADGGHLQEPVTAHPDDAYIIGDDDVLSISVWNEPNLTRLIPVRSDGKISLPLIGEIQASGRTPAQLQQDIALNLRSFITDPQVTIIVQEIHSQKFNILGEVNKPGSYELVGDTTIVDAIALAGGFRDFAKKKSVYILRPNLQGGDSKIPFNYPAFIKGKNTNQNIKLKPRDTVVVP